MRIGIASSFVIAIALGNAACTSEPPAPSSSEHALEAKQAALVSVEFYDGERKVGSCAGVLVGPRAVLTAGHCASNRTHAFVLAPNAGGKRAESHRAWWFDWTDPATPKTSPQLHDVAIISLDTPIELKKYPAIADQGVPDGTKTLYVRRVKASGKSKIAFEAVPGRARPQKNVRAHYYKIDSKLGSLDSGGPVFDAKSGKIVGVVSTHGKSHALYVTKTRSLTKWLRQQLLALLDAAPKSTSTTTTAPDAGAPKAPAPATPAPSSSTAPKAPSSGAAPSSSAGKMGKQDGAATKAAAKKPAAPKASTPKSGEEKDAGENEKECAEGDTECEQEKEKECENGDIDCDPETCGSAEGGGSAGDCETPCEGGDESCNEPSCDEGDQCQCEGDETTCGGEDPFEDPDYGNEDQNADNQNPDDPANDPEGDYTAETDPTGGDPSDGDVANDTEYAEADDYSEAGYDDTGDSSGEE